MLGSGKFENYTRHFAKYVVNFRNLGRLLRVKLLIHCCPGPHPGN